MQNSPLVGQSQTASISQSYPEKEGAVLWNNRFELVNVECMVILNFALCGPILHVSSLLISSHTNNIHVCLCLFLTNWTS